MAWNGSDGSATPAKPVKKAPSALRGLVAGLLVVAVAAVGLFYMLSNNKGEEPSAPKPTPSRIVEATPAPAAPAPTNAIAQAEVSKFTIPSNVTADARGILRYPNGLRWRDPRRKVSTVKVQSRLSKLFKHGCERQIAGLLEIEPGVAIFGTVTYSKNFKQDLLKSLEEPIVYDKDDSEEDRELKIAVEQTKRELKERMDAGEDPVKILKDTREELQRLGEFREDLKKHVENYIKDENYTDQDVKDFTEAANQMLAKEGLPPLKSPNVIVRQMIIKRAKESAVKVAAGTGVQK